VKAMEGQGSAEPDDIETHVQTFMDGLQLSSEEPNVDLEEPVVVTDEFKKDARKAIIDIKEMLLQFKDVFPDAYCLSSNLQLAFQRERMAHVNPHKAEEKLSKFFSPTKAPESGVEQPNAGITRVDGAPAEPAKEVVEVQDSPNAHACPYDDYNEDDVSVVFDGTQRTGGEATGFAQGDVSAAEQAETVDSRAEEQAETFDTRAEAEKPSGMSQDLGGFSQQLASGSSLECSYACEPYTENTGCILADPAGCSTTAPLTLCPRCSVPGQMYHHACQTRHSWMVNNDFAGEQLLDAAYGNSYEHCCFKCMQHACASNV